MRKYSRSTLLDLRLTPRKGLAKLMATFFRISKLMNTQLFGLSAGLLLVSPGAVLAQTPNPYPPEVKQQFVERCTSESLGVSTGAAQQREFCSCSFEYFQTQITFDEFLAANARVEKDRQDIDPKVAQAMSGGAQACVSELVQ